MPRPSGRDTGFTLMLTLMNAEHLRGLAFRSALINISVLLWFFCGSRVLTPVQAAEGRDPFQFGPREATQSTSGPLLTGIIWDAYSPLAIVEGEPVTLGQTVRGWQIIEIQPDYLIVQRDSQRQTLVPGSPWPPE